MTFVVFAALLGALTQHQATGQQPPPKPVDPHAGHVMTEQKKPADLPPITEQDRRAAFPAVDGHSVHDSAIHYFVLFDQLEWQPRDGVHGVNLDSKGWIGGDLNRFWFRAEGESEGRRIGEAEAHVLYGRAFARWWDVVVGVRQDIRPGPAETWAAVGIQGLAPYWFEVEATAYFGKDGRTHFRFETEYELLLTNRLILQPLVEVELYGKAVPERRLGAGLSSANYGLRVRYEFRREFAPYLGVTWKQRYGGTAAFARAAGEEAGGVRLVLGLRTWF